MNFYQPVDQNCPHLLSNVLLALHVVRVCEGFSLFFEPQVVDVVGKLSHVLGVGGDIQICLGFDRSRFKLASLLDDLLFESSDFLLRSLTLILSLVVKVHLLFQCVRLLLVDERRIRLRLIEASGGIQEDALVLVDRPRDDSCRVGATLNARLLQLHRCNSRGSLAL